MVFCLGNAGWKVSNMPQEYRLRAVLVLFFLVGVVQDIKLKKKNGGNLTFRLLSADYLKQMFI